MVEREAAAAVFGSAGEGVFGIDEISWRSVGGAFGDLALGTDSGVTDGAGFPGGGWEMRLVLWDGSDRKFGVA